MTINLALRRKEDLDFKVILGYLVRLSQKQNNRLTKSTHFEWKRTILVMIKT